jgi:hypothetical protein
VALADGQDFGLVDDGSPDNRFAVAAKWSRHFDEKRYKAAAAADDAERLLKTAKSLDLK